MLLQPAPQLAEEVLGSVPYLFIEGDTGATCQICEGRLGLVLSFPERSGTERPGKGVDRSAVRGLAWVYEIR